MAVSEREESEQMSFQRFVTCRLLFVIPPRFHVLFCSRVKTRATRRQNQNRPQPRKLASTDNLKNNSQPLTSLVNNSVDQSEAPELPARLYKRENGDVSEKPLGTNAASLPCFYDRLEHIKPYAPSSTHTASDLSPVSSNSFTEASRASDNFFAPASGSASLASPTLMSLSNRSTPVPNELQLRSFRPREPIPAPHYPTGSDVVPMPLQSPRRVGGIVTSPSHLRPEIGVHHHMRRLSPRSTRYGDAPASNRLMTSPATQAPVGVVRTMAPLPEHNCITSAPFAYHVQPQQGLKRRPSLNERYTALPHANAPAFDPTQTKPRDNITQSAMSTQQNNNKHNSLPRRGLRDASRDVHSDALYR